MAYQVLARKCRPQRFSEIVGQEHITRTLQNAIAQNRVGHAYLFVGSRGIGKTTTARIFAKALNCEAGTVTEPCCECQSCREISNGTSLDVSEIDGASHNKVEHIRDLRENVQYSPSRSRYKIYIIDEVHMLTTQAWNALLKTLEEPPPHVKFFFATTEPHKVLPTIVSRCQRFDLKRISVSLIVRRLRDIADSEGIKIEERALVAMARAADGAMRDAQSIFDQIIAFCDNGQEDGQPISEEDVINVFGLASGQELKELIKAILTNDVQSAVRVVHELADRGRDLERLFGDLVYFVRNLMICQVCDKPQELLDTSEAELNDLAEVAGTADVDTIQCVLEGLVSQERALRAALNKRVYLEVALVRVMHEASSVKISDVIKRLNELRKQGPEIPAVEKPVAKVRETAPEQPSDTEAAKPSEPVAVPAEKAQLAVEYPPPPSAQAVPDDNTPPEPSVDGQDPTIDSLSPPSPSSPPAVEEPVDDAADPRQYETQVLDETTPAAMHDPAVSDVAAADDDEQDENAEASAGDLFQLEQPEDELVENCAPEEQEEAETTFLLVNEERQSVHEPAAAVPAVAEQPQDDVNVTRPPQQRDSGAMILQQLVQAVAALPGKQYLKATFQGLRPTSFDGIILQVAYGADFPQEHLEVLQRPGDAAVIDQTLQKLCQTEDARFLIKRWIEGISNQDQKRRLIASPEARERVEKNTFVQRAIDLFGGEIIDARG